MYYIKIYGSDTLIIPDDRGEVDRTAVLALTDLTSINLTCYGVYLDFEDGSEELTGAGGSIGLLSRTRDTYSVPLQEVDILDYPSLLTDLRTILAKRYWYFEGNTTIVYDLPYLINLTDKMIVLGSIVKEETETVGRNKFVTLTMKKRTLNNG